MLEGKKPIVFITMATEDVRAVITAADCAGVVMDMFRTFVEPLEHEFGMKSNHRVGRFSDAAKSEEYNERIEAINFSLAHDDGQSAKNLASADVILVGVQPLRQDADHAVPGDAARHQGRQLPADPRGLRARPAAVDAGAVQGQVLRPDDRPRAPDADPQRAPRRSSKYAALDNCRYEVREAEAMMKRNGIAWLSSTHKSIEEIAATILRDIRPDKLIY